MSLETTRETTRELPSVEVHRARIGRQRRTQREILLEVLRMAAQVESWMTLEELAGKTRFPPTSISAQLRHLRKVRYGAWKVERRRRDVVREELVWEYRLGI